MAKKAYEEVKRWAQNNKIPYIGTQCQGSEILENGNRSEKQDQN